MTFTQPAVIGDLNIVRMDGTSVSFSNVIINARDEQKIAPVMDNGFLVFETEDSDAPVYVPNVSHFSFEPELSEPLAEWEQELLRSDDPWGGRYDDLPF